MSRTAVLVICPDKTGPLMAGTAIRSLEIARALASECAVTLAVPDGSERVVGDLVQVRVPSESPLPALIEAADVVVVAGRAELMSAIRKPLVVDLYDPFILSDLEFYGGRFTRSGGRPLLALRWLQHHLENGDFFLCASTVQRSFWLGMLAAAGRVNHANYAADHGFEELLAVVPFGFPGTPPVHTAPTVKGVIPGIGAGDKVALWAGGLWNWVDPLALLRAMHRLRSRRPEIKALFLGVRHPNPDIGEMEMATRALALAHELGLHNDGASFVDWVPYEQRQNYLLEADVGVSLHQPSVEAQFAFRTRVLDYFWCGLPMVLSRGDELAGLVERENLGITVPEGDPEAVAEAITRLIDVPASEERAARFAAVRRALSWESVTEPLRRFCRAPHIATDKATGAWFAPDTKPAAVLRKEDALISEETLSRERELSPMIGQFYKPTHGFDAAYDNLCRVDVLVWTTGRPTGDLVFTLFEDNGAARRVARVVAPLVVLPANDWHRFEFRPIVNSRGRRYRFTLETSNELASGLSLWLCTPAGGGEATPALMTHYLVKGIVDSLPLESEAFLFLHNTTVSEQLVPGVHALVAEATAAGAPVLAERKALEPPAPPAEASPFGGLGPAAADENRDAAPAAASVEVTKGSTPGPTTGVTTSQPISEAGVARAAADDAIRAELARVSTELAVARRQLQSVAGVASASVLVRLAREIARGLVRALRAGVRAAGLLAVLAVMALSVPLALVLAAGCAAVDLRGRLRRRSPAAGTGAVGAVEIAAATNGAPRARRPVSVVIPTWNGQPLLAMSLPPLQAALAAYAPGGEIIVVDNGSSDGSCEWTARECPTVRVIALDRNHGFAGAANRGVHESRHATVILLNNDMVVEPDFIAPLLEAMDAEPETFGVSCQIDFIDKSKPRWETGKVHARWKYGTITLFHLERYDDDRLYPVFFAGGGASAYDREKFLILGGFDEAVFSPVYIEDVDLGYRAWKRGWPSLFQPKSVVHHKHRGTTRRLWSETTIHSFFVKNLAALVWKNVGDWRLLSAHLAGLVILPLRIHRYMGARAAIETWRGMLRQIPTVLKARAREVETPRRLDDATIFLASRYRYAFRGVFGRRPARVPDARPRVLMVSPYSPYPAVHGGAVRMLALLRRLAPVVDVTLISYADTAAELAPRSIDELNKVCRGAHVLERPGHTLGGMLEPAKTRGFWSESMSGMIEYLLDRDDYDVAQVEYTHMAHLMPPAAPGLVRALVEHDVSFVSIGRSRATARGPLARVGLWFEWMRMLRYEVAAVERADLVLTMSDTDRAVLGRFVDTRHVVTIPNGVDCGRFPFAADSREPDTVLFVGFFRHQPNVEAVCFFCREVLPLVRRDVPTVRFRVVGAYPSETVRRLADEPGVEVTGMVDDIAAYYRASAVFVAPVLQGSGTRLKILEAMASGCAVVSTSIGAEGLGATDGVELVIADTPDAMARAIVALLADPERRATLARQAREFVVARYDWDIITARLVNAYRAALDDQPRT